MEKKLPFSNPKKACKRFVSTLLHSKVFFFITKTKPKPKPQTRRHYSVTSHHHHHTVRLPPRVQYNQCWCYYNQYYDVYDAMKNDDDDDGHGHDDGKDGVMSSQLCGVDAKAEEFIRRSKEIWRLERQKSVEEYNQMLARGV